MNKPDKDWGLGTEDTGMKGRTSLGHIFGQVSLVFFFMLSLAPMANIFICQTVIESFAGFIVCAVRVPMCVWWCVLATQCKLLPDAGQTRPGSVSHGELLRVAR